MEQDPTIEARIAALAADREHGATELARLALDILASAVERLGERDREASLERVAGQLTRAKPSMAAVKNAVARALADARLAQGAEPRQAVERARRWLDEAARAAAEQAAALLPADGAVLTCSYSSSVVNACAAAARAGKRVRALAIESRVGDIAYGERMAHALAVHGISTEIVADSALARGVDGVDLVLVGADRVLPDGSLVNGVPTRALAERMAGVAPLYVVCETFKLDDERSMERGFDLVPAALITWYVTERGVVRPADMWGR